MGGKRERGSTASRRVARMSSVCGDPELARCVYILWVEISQALRLYVWSCSHLGTWHIAAFKVALGIQITDIYFKGMWLSANHKNRSGFLSCHYRHVVESLLNLGHAPKKERKKERKKKRIIWGAHLT